MQAVPTPTAATAESDTAVAALEFRGLTKRFGKGVHAVTAVDHVSLTVPYGQVFGVLGPNGAGKTTVIKMMCGLVTPTSGEVRVGGHDVLAPSSRVRATCIGPSRPGITCSASAGY